MEQYKKVQSVCFTGIKSGFHIHPCYYVTRIYLNENPNFLIPNIGDYVELMYEGQANLFKVKSREIKQLSSEINITVKKTY